MEPDALFFDIGNVLVLFDYEAMLDRLREGRVDPTLPHPEELPALKDRYEGGQISREEFIGECIRLLQWTRSVEEIEAYWADIFHPNKPMEALVERLAGKRLLHISNISDIHRDFLWKQYPHFHHFEGGIYSYEAKLLKPDPAVFDLALTRYGLDPARILYVDDLEKNVEAARSRGIRTWHYDAGRHSEFEIWLKENGVQF